MKVRTKDVFKTTFTVILLEFRKDKKAKVRNSYMSQNFEQELQTQLLQFKATKRFLKRRKSSDLETSLQLCRVLSNLKQK